MKYNPKTTAIPEIIPVVLICTAGIISAGRIASLSSSFVPQGLFRPAECISILLFFTTGMISAARIHLYLPLLLHRDYFHRPDSSPACSFAPQGLFPPARCIPAFLFCYTGIISVARIHLYLALLLHKDYFRRPDSSLSSSFAPQGLFPPPGFIPSLLFCSTGIISTGQMHPCLPLLSHRDYFAPSGCISILLFCSTGIILPRLDASLSSSFAPQGLFLPPGFIPPLLFCSTEIISAGAICTSFSPA